MIDRRDPEKYVWDTSDFDRMGWHDATIYAVAFEPQRFEVSLDVDYIFEWLQPSRGEEFFRFWVSPCTVVFENVYDFELDGPGPGSTFQVNEIRRDQARTPRNAGYIAADTEWQWTVDCHHGEIRLWSTGFTQHVRRASALIDMQHSTWRIVAAFHSLAAGLTSTGERLTSRCS